MIRPQYVDLSVFNIPPEKVNWPDYIAWAKQWDGKSRVSMRVTEGSSVLDQHFAGYRAGAEAHGVDIIIFYHFADPDLNSSSAEFTWFTQNLGDIRAHDEIMLDAEKDVAAFTSGWALAWSDAVKQQYGIDPDVYASTSFIQKHFQDARMAELPLILANWQFDPNEQPAAPAPWTDYAYLQYTDQATNIPGLGTAPVDADVAIGPIDGKASPGTVVAHLPQSSQFETGESSMLCCPWSVAELRYAGRPGKRPIGTGEMVDQWADAEYTKYIGPNTSGNPQGSTINNIAQFFSDATGDGGTNKLAYNVIAGINMNSMQPSDSANIHAAIDAGFPVLAIIVESSIKRRDGSSPYAWNTNGMTHCFTIIGYTEDGYYQVADEANITNTWPDQYAEAAMNIQWASVVQLPWLPAIPTGDPKNWSTSPVITSMIPANWTDKVVDGDPRLFNPYTPFFVRGAFRDTVLAWSGGWESFNVPTQNEEQNPQFLELSNQPFGPGTSQTFRIRRLEMVAHQNNVIISGWLGTELVYYKTVLVPQVQSALAQAQATIQSQASQITSLQQQLSACQSAGGAPPKGLLDAVNQAAITLATIAGDASDVGTRASALSAALAPFITK